MKKMILGTLVIGTLLGASVYAGVGSTSENRGGTQTDTSAGTIGYGTGCTDCDLKNGFAGTLTENTNKVSNVEDGNLGETSATGQ